MLNIGDENMSYLTCACKYHIYAVKFKGPRHFVLYVKVFATDGASIIENVADRFYQIFCCFFLFCFFFLFVFCEEKYFFKFLCYIL